MKKTIITRTGLFTFFCCLWVFSLKSQNTLDGLISESIPLIDGASIEGKELEGKTVIINIWATWCKHCLNEIPDLNNLVQQHKNRTDVVFLAVAFHKRDNPEKISRFLKRHPFLFQHIAPNKGLDFFISMNNLRYPTTLVYDATGNLKKKFVGALKNRELVQIHRFINK